MDNVGCIHDFTVWCNTEIIDKFNIIEANKICDITEVVDQMYCEIELNPFHDVIPMEENWIEEDLDLMNNNLYSHSLSRCIP